MDLIEFLTSKEIIVVYIVAAVACLLCFIIYLVEKNNIKVKQRHNTRELNKLVEEIKEEVEEEPQIIYEEPILESIEEVRDTPIIVEEVKEEPAKVEEELQYTSIEPDQETAQLELAKVTEELRKQEEELDSNIKLTSYEEEQEENAIISLEELVKKSKDMYQANELREYSEEGNEPITLQELEAKVGMKASEVVEEFKIENVVSKEEIEELTEEEQPQIKQITMDDFNTIKVEKEEPKEEVKRFHTSPIISPIYGIEKQEASSNDLELENTANYEKLDAEIKKTNEFLMTLKDLQQKLD